MPARSKGINKCPHCYMPGFVTSVRVDERGRAVLRLRCDDCQEEWEISRDAPAPTPQSQADASHS